MKPGPSLRQRFKTWRRSLGWSDLLLAVAIANFAIYVLVSIRIGGDALNGHFEHGCYFLNSHGRLTEVDRLTFLYSEVHSYVTIALMLAAAIARAIVRSARRREDKALARRVREWRPL